MPQIQANYITPAFFFDLFYSSGIGSNVGAIYPSSFTVSITRRISSFSNAWG